MFTYLKYKNTQICIKVLHNRPINNNYVTGKKRKNRNKEKKENCSLMLEVTTLILKLFNV